ncbi:putative ribonuclease H-like domain-containing protein, partial [Tanacetum coccineum]
EDGPHIESDEKDKSEDDSSPKEVNADGQHVNTASLEVNTGRFKLNIVDPSVNTASSNDQDSPKDKFKLGASHTLEATHVEFFCDEDELEVYLGNITNSYTVPPTPNTRIHKDHPITNVIGDVKSSVQTRRMTKPTSEQGWKQCQEEILQFKLQQVWKLMDLRNGKRAIRTKWVFRNKKDERGIMIKNTERLVVQGHRQEEGIDYEEVFAPVARIKAIRLFLAYASFMGFLVYQMDVKSAFLYGTIEKEIYVSQPPGFKDPDHPNKVYKVVKALYGLHQAPRAWYETLANYLLGNGFKREKTDQTLFLKKQKGDIFLVQVYVDDIIFGSTNKELCTAFEKLMKDKFQMSSIGELTFFLGLKVQKKEDGIFISQDKYVAEIVKKFNYTYVKSDSTLVDLEKPLVKDGDADDVDVHLYRSMVGSLMYLTTSRPYIMFACKKQTVVATSTTEAEYVAAASCCGQDKKIEYLMLNASPLKHVKRGRDTKIPQSSGPLVKVGDEVVHKELGDRMEKATTTASSLEAEQDSDAQTRFETTSKQSNNPPLSRVNTLGCGEDSMKLIELMAHYTTLSELIINNQTYSMATNEETNAAGTDTRPPMLVENDYESWKIRIIRSSRHIFNILNQTSTARRFGILWSSFARDQVGTLQQRKEISTRWFTKDSFHNNKPAQDFLQLKDYATVHVVTLLLTPIQRKVQCKEPKRKMDSQYFKDKALLMEAKEKGDVLDAEAEAFLADVECTAPYDQPQALTTTKHLSQEMHQEEHLDSDAETEIDDNTIPYHQYLLDTEAQNVPTEVSADTSDKKELSQEQAYWLSANEIARQASKPTTPATPFVHKSRPPASSGARGNTLKVLELEAEISKQKQLITESEKRFAFLEQNYVSLQLKFQNYKQCIDTSSASNAIFEINKLRQQLQGKDDTIRNLDAQINIMKVLNVGSTEGSCDQQALETDRIQLKDTITSLRIQLDGLKVENVSLKRRYDELSQANTHSRTAYTEKLSALTAGNNQLKAQVTGKTSSGPSTSETPKVLAPGMYNLVGQFWMGFLDVCFPELQFMSQSATTDMVDLLKDNGTEMIVTMVIFAKAPLFLWAEAVATACYTLNRSLIHTLHGKTYYELLKGKKPNLQYFRVFGSLCYPTNDYDDVGKLKAKADIGLTSVKTSSGSHLKTASATKQYRNSKLLLYSQGCSSLQWLKAPGTQLSVPPTKKHASRPDIVFAVCSVHDTRLSLLACTSCYKADLSILEGTIQHGSVVFRRTPALTKSFLRMMTMILNFEIYGFAFNKIRCIVTILSAIVYAVIVFNTSAPKHTCYYTSPLYQEQLFSRERASQQYPTALEFKPTMSTRCDSEGTSDVSVSGSKGRIVADSIAARLTRPTVYKFKTDCRIIPV